MELENQSVINPHDKLRPIKPRLALLAINPHHKSNPIKPNQPYQ